MKINKKLTKKFKGIQWRSLIICFIIVYLSAFIGSLFTSPNVSSDWYESIKPEITPPNYIFPIVWNILFFLIALSLYTSLSASKKKEDKKIIFVLFGINLLLNIFWSVLFFGLQNPFLAFFELIIFWISILLLILFTYRINKFSSYILIPYLVWVSFAGILNYLSAF